MSLKEVNLKTSYESGIGDLVQDFYVPTLEQTIAYDRIAGFFSSTSLAIASKGIAGLIKNKGHMRLLVSPVLSEADAEIINNSITDREALLEKCLLQGINVDNIEDELVKNHVNALGWMLCHGFLEIKIAVMANYSDALFHEKIAVMYDKNNDVVAFSGSINETGTAWIKNQEQFHVFKSWVQGQDEYVNDDVTAFEEHWNGKRINVKIFDLPEVVKKNLIEKSKDFDLEQISLERYVTGKQIKGISKEIPLFSYQKEAVEKWGKNNKSLMFEMATGTGKTRTAIACIDKLLKSEDRMLVVISCPQITLSVQWEREIKNLGISFDEELFADGTNPGWGDQLKIVLNKLNSKFYKHVVVYTTHITGCKKEFIDKLKTGIKQTKICFVGDEAHGLGAEQTKEGLLSIYKYRIGLSATPKRWFDDEGTGILSNYFGNDDFNFPIAKALNTINPITNRTFLVQYYYRPVFVELNHKELDAYLRLTKTICKISKFKNSDEKYKKRYENLLFKRADIIKNAEEKLQAFQRLIDKERIDKTLIFVSPQQKKSVLKMLNDRNISAHEFTEQEGTKPEKQYGDISERDNIINIFKSGGYNALVAIKCLNEGIDIPTANTAILLESSSNPREYVQRIGRVIRDAPGKNYANIFDFIVIPTFVNQLEPEERKIEKKILEKEMVRVMDMASDSIKGSEVYSEISDIYRRLFDL